MSPSGAGRCWSITPLVYVETAVAASWPFEQSTSTARPEAVPKSTPTVYRALIAERWGSWLTVVPTRAVLARKVAVEQLRVELAAIWPKSECPFGEHRHRLEGNGIGDSVLDLRTPRERPVRDNECGRQVERIETASIDRLDDRHARALLVGALDLRARQAS